MDVRRWLLILLCAVAALVQAEDAPVPGKIMLASEEWNDYTNKDGSGLAWDVLRQVFEPAGITVQTRSVPYTRSVGLAQRGEVDGWVGAWPSRLWLSVPYAAPRSSTRLTVSPAGRVRSSCWPPST